MFDKEILDVCCGGKMFWFDKKNQNTLYLDKRREGAGIVEKWQPNFEVNPDLVMDFRNLDLPDESFSLIVFDPPHIFNKGISTDRSVMAKKYGTLHWDTWKDDLSKGFDECWRVLRPKGTLIFKWHDHQVKIREVVNCFSKQPLFGQMSGKGGKSHWLVFFKES